MHNVLALASGIEEEALLAPCATASLAAAALHAATGAQREPELDASDGGLQIGHIGQWVARERRPELEREEPGARLRIWHEASERARLRQVHVHEQVRGARAVQPVAVVRRRRARVRVARAVRERDWKRSATQAHAQQLAGPQHRLRLPRMVRDGVSEGLKTEHESAGRLGVRRKLERNERQRIDADSKVEQTELAARSK